MAAASGEMRCGESTIQFETIAVQFFEMIPLRRIQWQCKNMNIEELSIEKQQELLSLTVNSDQCRQFPPSTQYQRAFVKKLLTMLEEYGAEICDEMYETYTQLVQQGDVEEDSLCYKTYTLNSEESITIQESVNMISFGTTGLSTWQAAQHLAEWAVENTHVLDARHIVELGSGLGMLGLSVCQKCRPASYTFTDCHTHVLRLLASNIHINAHNLPSDTAHSSMLQRQCVKKARHSYEEDVHADSTVTTASNNFDGDSDNSIHKSNQDHITTSGHLKHHEMDEFKHCDGAKQSESTCSSAIGNESRNIGANNSGDLQLSSSVWNEVTGDLYVHKGQGQIRVSRLDWENVTEEVYQQFGQTDIILAADVVYDTRIIPPLVAVLKAFLSRTDPASPCVDTLSPCVAYIASTIRNEDTRDQFLIALSAEGLRYEPVDPPSLKLFHYDTSVPIEIIKLTAPRGQVHST